MGQELKSIKDENGVMLGKIEEFKLRYQETPVGLER